MFARLESARDIKIIFHKTWKITLRHPWIQVKFQHLKDETDSSRGVKRSPDSIGQHLQDALSVYPCTYMAPSFHPTLQEPVCAPVRVCSQALGELTCALNDKVHKMRPLC